MSPHVSIITPSYNSEYYIEETLLSVLAQSYQNWEMIIIDDCSTDKSIDIIQRYTTIDSRIKLLHNTANLGVAESRNKGIGVCSGEYIALLDSDDIWFPKKLEKQIHLMQTKNIFMSYSAYNTIDEKGQTMNHFHTKDKITYHDMLKTSTIGTLTTIYNAKKLGKFYFMKIGHEDYVFKLHILKQIPYAEGIDEILASYRIAKNSISSNKLKAATWQWNIYRNIEKISFFKSIYYFLNYTYHGIFKYK